MRRLIADLVETPLQREIQVGSAENRAAGYVHVDTLAMASAVTAGPAENHSQSEQATPPQVVVRLA